MNRQNDISLIDQVVDRINMENAIKKVRKNNGKPGVDGVTVNELDVHMKKYYSQLTRKLKNGTYQPQPVKRVEIPKDNGGTRLLGIPCVRDRVVQQAILQVIDPIIDPHFSDYSYGFRKGRNAHQAIEQVQQYYEKGYRIVVDCDLKNYFDTINHQRLRSNLEYYIQDEIILRVIWSFLKSGVLDQDFYVETEVGTPQGGPLSPLLANVYLHHLDRELERRGHKFARYADDFVIYVKSKRAGERVMKSITAFIEKDLHLTVNKEKSQITTPTQSKFLGFHVYNHMGKVRSRPSRSAKRRFRNKLRKLTRRNRPGTFPEIIKEINRITVGWINYYKIAFMKTFMVKTKAWLNHRMRQIMWKRWKKVATRYKWLKKLGINHDEALKTAASRKGYWRISRSEIIHRALPNKMLVEAGLKDLTYLYER